MSIKGRTVDVVDGMTAAITYELVFIRQEYCFPATRPDPRIIDCGANIGITVLYWKHLYPQSRILAFEADPHIYQVLVRNCGGLPDVEIHNRAVWISSEELWFYCEGADGGHLTESPERSQSGQLCRIQGVRLRDYLDQPIDLLKVDVEGAEVDVLVDCGDRLRFVDRLFLEYHSFVDRPQRLDELFRVLREADFRVHIVASEGNPQPFMNRRVHNSKYLHAFLYCFRE